MSVFTSIYEIFVRGGIFMIPLAIAGVAAITLVIERLLFLRENRINGDRLQFELQTALKEDDLDKAIVLAARTKGVVGRVLEEGLRRIQTGETNVEAATEKIIHSEMVQMERSRDWLITISTISPLLGILGSVYGMIVAFNRIETTGGTDPKLLAGGISIALICTVTGLVIAIPTTVAHDFVRKQTNSILHAMDLYLLEIGDWLGKKKKAAVVNE
jgi:biopolymer transport protein ExbB